MAITVNGYSVNEVGEAADWSPREHALLSAFAQLMPSSGTRIIDNITHHNHIILVDSNETIRFYATNTGVSVNGNISATGDLLANSGTFNAGVSVNGIISATGNIRTPGYLLANSATFTTGLFVNGNIRAMGDLLANSGTFNIGLFVNGNIRATGNISATGDLLANSGTFLNNVGIGAAPSSSSVVINPALDIGKSGQIRIRNTYNDNTGKSGYLTIGHYANSANDVLLLAGENSIATNKIKIGGGISYFKALTDIEFWLAPDTSTSTGSMVGNITSTGLYIQENIYTSDGKIGIGTSNPSHHLEISENTFSNAYICISGNNPCGEFGLIFENTINGANKIIFSPSLKQFEFHSDGNQIVKIGGLGSNLGTIEVSALKGSGNRAVYSDSNGCLTNTTSDKSLKKDIESLDIESCLSQVNKLKPISYYWIDEKKFGARQEIGLIAQEVDEVVPEVIGMNADGKLSLDYARLVTILIGAVKELALKINDLQNQIDKLK